MDNMNRYVRTNRMGFRNKTVYDGAETDFRNNVLICIRSRQFYQNVFGHFTCILYLYKYKHITIISFVIVVLYREFKDVVVGLRV